jgi:phosphoribosylaminoimidazolecarboxamide formyltransferase/IMP cyclohydrolase
MLRTIERVLISVSDKTGLAELAQVLQSYQPQILSTGGTAKVLRELGLEVTDISDHTGFPEMLDGRVKTLHPLVHGGLLGCTGNPQHARAMEEHHIAPISLVIVNLYPFRETVKKQAPFEECIENIDIGGPSMIRSAAKNHEYVTVVTDPGDYAALIAEMAAQKGATGGDFRRKMAAKAFAATASYDAAISNWFAGELGELFPGQLTVPSVRKQVLRYGENPHQQAALYVTDDRQGVGAAVQIQGKELSFNNINDTDAALELVAEFSEPAAVIIKHANPCGAASAGTLLAAFEAALASDPVSAFGGIIALNQPLDAATAEALSTLFLEVIIAPGIDDAAKLVLAAKKNLRVLINPLLPSPQQKAVLVKSIGGGLLLQERDHAVITAADLTVVSKRQPTAQEVKDMLFAFKICKHVKSNAIVLAKNGATIGVGAGQMSRVDSVRIAAQKAAEGEGNRQRAQGSVVASDAFFPFADGLILAHEAGATAAIQPGGSVRDAEVIAAADERGMAMVFTGKRHFKH